MKVCSVVGCSDKHKGRGFCHRHLERWKRNGEPGPAGMLKQTYDTSTCAAEGCERPRHRSAWCTMHGQRVRAGNPVGPAGPLPKRRPPVLCTVDGCGRPRHVGDLCGMHAHRVRKHGDPGPVGPLPAPEGRYVNNAGYWIIKRPDHPNADRRGWALEHRVVMATVIGRALLAEENVHHLNGDKLDNRPANLELWNTSQPSGQRVEDKLRWARHIIELYGGVRMVSA